MKKTTFKGAKTISNLAVPASWKSHFSNFYSLCDAFIEDHDSDVSQKHFQGTKVF